VDQKKMLAIKMGLVDYQKAYDLQLKIHQLVSEEKLPHTFLILEHSPVITLGISGKESNILVDEVQLNKLGIQVYRSTRGGDVTYHGPGQIVGYPIFNLRYLGRKVRHYISNLEGTIIRMLKDEHGIDAVSDPKFPGVWIGNNKITAIGCRISRWVSMHGFAYNVNTNLDHFKLITPCGLVDKGVTSLERELGEKQDFDYHVDLTIRYLAHQFELDCTVENKANFLKKLEEL